VVKVEDNRSRRERRALASREVEPSQLGLAGAAQIACLHRQSGEDAKLETEYLVTSRSAARLPLEAFLNMDRDYWGVESGLHQRLDCSAFEDRMRVHHKGVVHILGLFPASASPCLSTGPSSALGCVSAPIPVGGSGMPVIDGTSSTNSPSLPDRPEFPFPSTAPD
jgi:hypothetical protein